MHILALVTDAFGGMGGIAQYNRDLMSALARSPAVARVTILPRAGRPGEALPTKARQLAPSADRAVWALRAIHLAARRRYDVVFCGHLHALPLAAALAALRRSGLWLQTHGIEAWTAPRRLVRGSAPRVHLVTCVSRHTRRRVLAWSQLPPERVRVLPNTVAPVYGPRARRRDLIERHGLAGKRVVLTIGRLDAAERTKGHDRIIAALADMALQFSDVCYLVVGSGCDRPRLEQLAQAHGMANRVVFAGQVPATDLPDYVALADVFAMPATGEGFGIVFLEAAAAGLPVIGGNCDGSMDALADGVIGRAIDPLSREALVAALADALSDRLCTRPGEVKRFARANFAGHVDALVRTLAVDGA